MRVYAVVALMLAGMLCAAWPEIVSLLSRGSVSGLTALLVGLATAAVGLGLILWGEAAEMIGR